MQFQFHVQSNNSNIDDLEEIIIFIGNQYGWEYIEPINEILGAFPLSHTWNKVDLDIPELEWEGKIQVMIENLNYSQLLKIAEFLSVPLFSYSRTSYRYYS